MTTAERLAADLQSRSLNIPVAPLHAPGIHPGRYLVVYRAGPRAQLLRRHAPAVLLAEQHDLVPGLDLAVHPEDAGVHRDPPQQRAPQAPDQGLGYPREGPPVPLRVPDRHRRREHRLLGREGQPVGYPIPRLKPPDAGYVALEGHRRPEPLLGRVPFVSRRVEAVERHAGTDAVVVRTRVPESGRGVRGVYQGAAERMRREDRVEDLGLAPRGLRVGVGG